MNLGVLEVLAGFIYCSQENGPKKASSCFEEFMVLNAPPPLTQLGLKVIIVIVMKKEKHRTS